MSTLSIDTIGGLEFFSAILEKDHLAIAQALRNNISFSDKTVLYRNNMISVNIGVTSSVDGNAIIDLDNIKVAGLPAGVFRKMAGDSIIKFLKGFDTVFEKVEKKDGNIYVKVRYILIRDIRISKEKVIISFDLCLPN